jgi:tripartite-type tricarboxylate transporter receptor subunit TctC
VNPRTILKYSILAAFLCTSAGIKAQSYPNKPVTLIMPFSPGAAADATARTIADALTKTLGQQFIVDNRPGAAGTIAYGLVARGPKDGYRILVAYSATTACSPALYPELTWNPEKDFIPIGMFATSPLVIAVSASLPVTTLGEFVEYIRKHPGEVNYGTSGIGSMAHLAAEQLQQKTRTEMTHIPFKGSGEVLPNLLSGVVQAVLTAPPSIKSQVQAGRLKALAITSHSRDPSMPEVPTVGEAGIPGVEFEAWYGLFAPAGTPKQVVDALADGLKRATDSPAYRQQAKVLGVEVLYNGPEATAARVRHDLQECTATVRNAGIKLN